MIVHEWASFSLLRERSSVELRQTMSLPVSLSVRTSAIFNLIIVGRPGRSPLLAFLKLARRALQQQLFLLEVARGLTVRRHDPGKPLVQWESQDAVNGVLHAFEHNAAALFFRPHAKRVVVEHCYETRAGLLRLEVALGRDLL